MDNLIVNIAIAILAPLVSYIARRLFDRKQWAQRTREIFTGVIILLMLADICLVILFIWKALPGGLSFPPEAWALLTNGLWIQLFLGLTLFFLWRRPGAKSSKAEDIGKELTVGVSREDKDGGIITKKIRSTWLNRPSGIADESRMLSPGEFQHGIDILKRQLDQPGYTFHPDFFIGINIGGAVIAAYLAGPKGAKKMIGSVMTEGDDHTAYHWVLPENPKDVRQVLIVDSQVKRGKSLRHVYDYIEEYFRQCGQNIEIKVAVLAACQVRKAITEKSSIDMIELNMDVHGVFRQDKKYLPEFLAFLSEGIIRLPGNIR